MPYYSMQDGSLSKSYSPRYLSWRRLLRDQLVLPQLLVCLVLQHACNDHELQEVTYRSDRPMITYAKNSGGPTNLSRDVRKWCMECQPCQGLKTTANRSKLLTGHAPVERPLRRTSVELVKNRFESVSTTGVRCKYVLTTMDHPTRFALVVTILN